MASIPMYKTVYNGIKQAIKDKVYEPGTFLPTEPQLEEIYSTSRTTIRKAVKLLASEGFVIVRQGRGTEVQNIYTLQKLNSVTSFTETLIKKDIPSLHRGCASSWYRFLRLLLLC